MAINLLKKQQGSGGHMPYTAEISRNNPVAFLFLIDQSGSMEEKYPDGIEKQKVLADVANKTLMNLIIRATKVDCVRDYFEVGAIGYGGNGIRNAFGGNLSDKVMHPISELEAQPLRIEDRMKLISDGAGGLVEQSFKFPVWLEPAAYGGTPMRAALLKAAEILASWCDSHPDSYPPTILHITDGEGNDGDPEEIAQDLMQLSTNDGNLLLFNLHLSVASGLSLAFPEAEENAPDRYAKRLYRMSSRLPAHMLGAAQEKHYKVSPGARAFIYNGDSTDIVHFFDIGTRTVGIA